MSPKRPFVLLLLALAVMLSACGSSVPTATPTPENSPTGTVLPTMTLAPTQTTAATPTPAAPTATPLAQVGPTNFPANIDPLTGLAVADVSRLNRRPLVVKVENLPREDRPQWGLSQADLVFENYTEQGTTRFTTVYYGQDATKIGPVRSARLFDINVVDMYKAVLVFSGAWEVELNELYASDFADRLVTEKRDGCPAFCRSNEDGHSFLMANTAAMGDYLTKLGIDNTRQNEDGMFFAVQPPTGGQALPQLFVRFSSAIYNRWDYDPATGTYLRFADDQNAYNVASEHYTQLVDRATGQPIRADNVVVLWAQYSQVAPDSGSQIYDVGMVGKGNALIARDGQFYQLRWERQDAHTPIHLIDADGKPFPFKPGNTWFEVVGANSAITPQQGSLRVTFTP